MTMPIVSIFPLAAATTTVIVAAAIFIGTAATVLAQGQTQSQGQSQGQASAQSWQQNRPGQYGGTGPVIDYTGRRSDIKPYGFATSGSRTYGVDAGKTIDQRLADDQQRQQEARRREDEAKKRAFEARERGFERDSARIEREARLRLENDKRKLQALERENNRR